MAEETNPLEELLQDELKDLYSAENQIIKALPKMAKAATSPELRRAFERHLEETRRQVERLDQIGDALEMKMTGKKCKGMEGLIAEGKELMEEDLEDDALDAGPHRRRAEGRALRDRCLRHRPHPRRDARLPARSRSCSSRR
jgi:ferritin-like metal-binding protein YciE